MRSGRWLGMLTPAAATSGDVVAALVLSLVVLLPLEMAVAARDPADRARRLGSHAARSRRRNRTSDGASGSCAGGPSSACADRWRAISRTTRCTARVRQMIRAGLPITAVLIAVNPIWGFSWYFNSENWATAAWQKIAESRVDDWREAMIDAAVRVARRVRASPRRACSTSPPTASASGDFSFIVIGDPGEGDPSQHALRDQLLLAARARRGEVRRDRLGRGLSGRRDEGLRAELLPAAEGRRQAGLRDSRQPRLVQRARRLCRQPDGPRDGARRDRGARQGRPEPVEHDRRSHRSADRVGGAVAIAVSACRPASSTRRSSSCTPAASRCIAIDTGIERRIDRETARVAEGGARSIDRAASRWRSSATRSTRPADRRSARDRSRTSTICCDRNGVQVMMAGDTHDFEYYRDDRTHYFVNGGGGAYLSIGTALDWPDRAALGDYAFYPRTDAVVGEARRGDAVLEMAGLVVGPPLRRVAVLGRGAVGGVRLQPRAVLSEFRRGAGRAIAQSRGACRRSASMGRCAGATCRPAARCCPPVVSSDDLVEFVLPLAPLAPAAIFLLTPATRQAYLVQP